MSGDILFKPERTKKAVEFYYEDKESELSREEASVKWENMSFTDKYEYMVRENDDRKRHSIANANYVYKKRLKGLNSRLNRSSHVRTRLKNKSSHVRPSTEGQAM